jgi:isocitrate lyase
MQLQNRFKTGLDIAQYTADIMRKDMADYDGDTAKYTQSLGCWHGFTAQQLAMSVKNIEVRWISHTSISVAGW